ncbi:putative Carboxylic ester hydrolase [Seiridium cardinale]
MRGNRGLPSALMALVALTPFTLGQYTTLPANATSTVSPLPTVVLDYASYEGSRYESGVDAYLGMRFAAPPLGDLRFRAPQDPIAETGIQEAKTYGPICVGTDQTITSTRDEDCLFVNVFTPSNATVESKLPVWVYIQGGGYATNSNSDYNGTEVVLQSGQGIVFVNFNYRVGIFGFLASEEVRQNGDLNVGLLDQRKLLLWVKSYIKQFGGDPDHIVIHGTSAGGGSVSYHLVAYGGRDDSLFHGAIAQSPFWPTAPTVNEMEFQYQDVLNETGCKTSNDSVTCLRALDVNSFIPLDVEGTFPGATGVARWYWLPVKDGDLIRGDKWDMFDRGEFIKVPLFVATDNNEGSYFVPSANTSSDVETFFNNNYPKLNDSQLEEIIDMYPLMAPLPEHGPWFPSVSAAYGDATFLCPANSLSANMAKFYSPDKVWEYRCYITTASLEAEGLGTPHTFEMPAILGTSLGSSVDSTWFDENAASVPIIMHYYISFIKSLDPNTYRYRSAPEWEPWGSCDGRRLRLVTNATRMEDVPHNMTAACNMWDELSDTMEV